MQKLLQVGNMQLNIDGVAFSYSSVPVLKDITAEITGPAFISILGPNGVGKSTLIHCINRILSPTSGTVMIDDVDVKGIPMKELAKIVGYVPYSANDTFPLSVVDTVLMGRHPHSRWGSLDTDLEIVYETLDSLGISDLAMRPFNELSAGQHQKAMLARGLVQEPKILLLDEPTSNLDVRHQLDVAKMLKRLSVEKGILIIMICHDINIAAKFSDSIILLSEGSIFAMGRPEEVITSDNLEKVYGVIADIVDDDGRPHAILKDSVPPIPPDTEVGRSAHRSIRAGTCLRGENSCRYPRRLHDIALPQGRFIIPIRRIAPFPQTIPCLQIAGIARQDRHPVLSLHSMITFGILII